MQLCTINLKKLGERTKSESTWKVRNCNLLAIPLDEGIGYHLPNMTLGLYSEQ